MSIVLAYAHTNQPSVQTKALGHLAETQTLHRDKAAGMAVGKKELEGCSLG